MFAPNENRYDKMVYNRLGNSGLKVSAVSLGLWQNFGFGSDFATAEEMVHTAFDLGITHFDIANNYGHPYNGSAEENFGKILDRGMRNNVTSFAFPQRRAMKCGTDLTATRTAQENTLQPLSTKASDA